MPMQRLILFALLCIENYSITFAENAHDYVVIHAPYEGSYVCSEHWSGQFDHLGDALGTDCMITGWIDEDGKKYSSMYRGNGHTRLV